VQKYTTNTTLTQRQPFAIMETTEEVTMRTHNKFRLTIILITIVAFIGIRLSIARLDAEIENNVQEIREMMEELKIPEEYHEN